MSKDRLFTSTRRDLFRMTRDTTLLALLGACAPAVSSPSTPEPTPTRLQKTPENREAALMERSKKIANYALQGDFNSLIANLDETVRHTFQINPDARQRFIKRVSDRFNECSHVRVDDNSKPSIEPANSSNERWLVLPLNQVCRIGGSNSRSQIVVVQRKDINGEFQPVDVDVKAFGN